MRVGDVLQMDNEIEKEAEGEALACTGGAKTDTLLPGRME
jgi:hypothetical protein